MVEDKRYNEKTCEFEATDKLPRMKCLNSSMLKQLAEVYTPTIFEMFQDQFDLFMACVNKQRRDCELLVEYVIGLVDHEGEWKVLFHPQEMKISRTCRRLEGVYGLYIEGV